MCGVIKYSRQDNSIHFDEGGRSTRSSSYGKRLIKISESCFFANPLRGRNTAYYRIIIFTVTHTHTHTHTENIVHTSINHCRARSQAAGRSIIFSVFLSAKDTRFYFFEFLLYFFFFLSVRGLL